MMSQSGWFWFILLNLSCGVYMVPGVLLMAVQHSIETEYDAINPIFENYWFRILCIVFWPIAVPARIMRLRLAVSRGIRRIEEENKRKKQ